MVVGCCGFLGALLEYDWKVFEVMVSCECGNAGSWFVASSKHVRGSKLGKEVFLLETVLVRHPSGSNVVEGVNVRRHISCESWSFVLRPLGACQVSGTPQAVKADFVAQMSMDMVTSGEFKQRKVKFSLLHLTENRFD